MRNELVES